MTMTFATKSLRRWAAGLGLGLVAALGATEAKAQNSVTFAQFSEDPSAPQNSFVFTNAASGSSFTASSVPVIFSYLAGFGAPVGPQQATLTINAPVTAVATLSGRNLDQPLGGTISFLRNSDNANLLTIVFTGDLLGKGGARGGSVDASSSAGDLVTFTSAFLDFSQTTARTLALALSGIDPGFSLNANGYLNSFAGDGAGSFSSSPFPRTVPQPASLVLLGIGLLGVPAYRAARRKAAVVA